MTRNIYLEGTGAWPTMARASDRPTPRRTKIVCTLGPATSTPRAIEDLVVAGMDVARLNMSHGTHDEHRARAEAVRAAAAIADRPVAVLADLCGPKIRIAKTFEERDADPGSQVVLIGAEAADGEEIPVTLDVLADAVAVGQAILVDDGKIRLRVDDARGGRVLCRVEVGGVLKPGKGVNLPDTALSIPALTEKDIADLAVAVELGADFVALSFVRSARDVDDLRDRLLTLDSPARIVSKIEKVEAIADLDAIVRASDVLMVARGDLGVEAGIAQVPLLQKRIIAAGRATQRAVITATQMLETMITAAVPTRAEASDVANAIMDGTSAVMLSAETASGSFPVEAVRVMDQIARVVEPSLPFTPPTGRTSIEDSLVDAACDVAERVDAQVVAMRTRTGASARHAAAFRGRRPTFAASSDPTVCRQLALEFGVVPALVPTGDGIEESWQLVLDRARAAGLAEDGDLAVLTGSAVVREGRTASSIALHRL